MRHKTITSLVALTFVLGLMLGMTSCATMNVPVTAESITGTVRSTFNNYVENYLNYRDRMKPGPERDAMRTTVEPKIKAVAGLLNTWELSIGTPSQATDYAAFDKAYSDLVSVLLGYGIITKAKGGTQ